MSRAERALILLLYFEAVVLLCALPAVVMPTDWMDAIHRAMRLGPMPRGPLVEYLTRSLSALYACWAPVLILVARDLRRNLPLCALLATTKILFGFVLLGLDVVVGMPLPWVGIEGPFVIALSVVVLGLTRRVARERQA